jgi:phosphohistidine phosphatase
MIVSAMRQLLLLRHAKSAWDDPALADHARPLNNRGKLAARIMAAEMQRLGLTPDAVLVSSARRTLHTLEALKPLEGSPIVTVSDELYLAPWPSLIAILNKVPETVRSVLLIGHNPGLHELALNLLAPGTPASPMLYRLNEGYPTGALCEFAIARAWHELTDGGGRLMSFIAPRDLPGSEHLSETEEGHA